MDIDRDLNHNFDLAKRTYLLSSKSKFPCKTKSPQEHSFNESLHLGRFSLEELQGLARETAGFFKSHYGVNFGSFSFPNFSQASFEAANPKDLIVKEESGTLYGSVICNGQDCFSDSNCKEHLIQSLFFPLR